MHNFVLYFQVEFYELNVEICWKKNYINFVLFVLNNNKFPYLIIKFEWNQQIKFHILFHVAGSK